MSLPAGRSEVMAVGGEVEVEWPSRGVWWPVIPRRITVDQTACATAPGMDRKRTTASPFHTARTAASTASFRLLLGGFTWDLSSPALSS